MPRLKLVVDVCQILKVQTTVLLISAQFATVCKLCCCALLAMQTSILNARHQWQLAPAADAAKKDPEEFKIWREDPAKFSFDGRYPLLEVYDKAKEAWKGRTNLCLLCLSASLSACLCGCLSLCEPKSWHVCWSQSLLCFHWLPMLPFSCTYLWACRPTFSMCMSQACWLLSLPACMPFLSLHCVCVCLTVLSDMCVLLCKPSLACLCASLTSQALQCRDTRSARQ